ncbi:CPBP family intramembrane glutamic endopeptidase [Ketobacter sp.]
MAFFKSLHPRQFFTVLHRIDQQSQVSVEPVRPSQRVFFTLFFVGLCLLLVNYAKFNGAFFWFYELFQSGDSLSLQRAFMYLRRDPFYELYLHAWWGFIHVLGFFILPALFIRCYLKERLNQHGLQWGAVHRHLKWYLVLVAPILGGVVVVLEFFFRGFMLNALRPAMGAQGILVMCLPYLMLHFSKPWIEATGALFFGLFLGILALHSRSIWGGVGVHVSIALAMDVAALMQTRGLPQQWTP